MTSVFAYTGNSEYAVCILSYYHILHIFSPTLFPLYHLLYTVYILYATYRVERYLYIAYGLAIGRPLEYNYSASARVGLILYSGYRPHPWDIAYMLIQLMPSPLDTYANYYSYA